jgi:hypothetical protein
MATKTVGRKMLQIYGKYEMRKPGPRTVGLVPLFGDCRTQDRDGLGAGHGRVRKASATSISVPASPRCLRLTSATFHPAIAGCIRSDFSFYDNRIGHLSSFSTYTDTVRFKQCVVLSLGSTPATPQDASRSVRVPHHCTSFAPTLLRTRNIHPICSQTFGVFRCAETHYVGCSFDPSSPRLSPFRSRPSILSQTLRGKPSFMSVSETPGSTPSTWVMWYPPRK